MPIYTIELPDGRKLKAEAPDEATAISGAQDWYAQQASPQPAQQPSPTGGDLSGLPLAYRALVGAGRGFTDVKEGVQQFGGFLGEEAARRVSGVDLDDTANMERTRAAQQERDVYDRYDLGTAGAVGRVAGNVAPTLVVPGAQVRTGAGFLANAGRMAGREAVVGGGIGATSFVPEGESRLKNTALGAAGGAGGSAALSGVSRTARGLTASRAGNEAGRLSDEFDVPLTVGELRGSENLRKLETQLERVPLAGTGGFRKRQAESLAAAADRLVRKYDDGVDDVGEALQGSLQRVLNKNKGEASKKFDEVSRLAQNADNPVVFTNTQRAARELLANEVEELPSGAATLAREFLELKPRDFEAARKLRSRISGEARRIQKQAVSGNVADTDVAALSRLASAVDDDLAAFAEGQGGDLLTAFREANSYFRENVVPFKAREFRRVLSDDFDTDNILATFVKRDSLLRGRSKAAGKLVEKLDMEGTKAVRFAVLREAFERATPDRPGQPFSPAKFALEIERLSSANKAIFSKTQKQELDGFVKLSRIAERAGQYAENPPTGIRAGDIMVGGGAAYGAAANLPAATAVGLSIKSISLLLTTPTGRSILARASKAKPGSAEMGRVMEQAALEAQRLGSRTGAVMATEANQSEQGQR